MGTSASFHLDDDDDDLVDIWHSRRSCCRASFIFFSTIWVFSFYGLSLVCLAYTQLYNALIITKTTTLPPLASLNWLLWWKGQNRHRNKWIFFLLKSPTSLFTEHFVCYYDDDNNVINSLSYSSSRIALSKLSQIVLRPYKWLNVYRPNYLVKYIIFRFTRSNKKFQ